MTKEEVAQVIAYCDENKISYKQRLAELRINPWSFYDAKRKYASKADGENAGEFLQLVPGGSFLPNPIKPSRSRSSKQEEVEAMIDELGLMFVGARKVEGEEEDGDLLLNL